jgi:hypothetical protein
MVPRRTKLSSQPELDRAFPHLEASIRILKKLQFEPDGSGREKSFRWYEIQLDGTKKYRKAVIGTVSEYKTESDAQKAADSLRLEVNEQTPRQQLQAISFETLAEHYKQHELPDIVDGTRPLGSEAGDDELRESFSTQVTYQGYLSK